MENNLKQPATWLIGLAFAALYLIWGSTYLGIKVAIETVPPLLMSAGRFLIAGAVLIALAHLKGGRGQSLAAWKHSFLVGGLLIAGGNGGITIAERWIDSSMAALIIATSPMLMALLGWWGGVEERPSWKAWLSLVGGFAGVCLLVISEASIGVQGNLWGYALALFSILSWTVGVIYSKRNPLSLDPWLQSGMQMFSGGAICLIGSAIGGELSGFELAIVSSRSWLAFGYLIAFGSLVGFTSYVFLLRYCRPSTVSSHTYVNPVVALVLGWLILGETLAPAGWLGSLLVLSSVVILLLRRARR